jgi:uncharacterized membrane protein
VSTGAGGLTGADWLTMATAAGSAVVGGFYFAFSGTVMPALKRLPPAYGAAAMQAVNRAAERPPFLSVFFGTAVAGVALAVSHVRELERPEALPRLIGSGLYLAGFALTVAYHVPRNNRLAGMSAESMEAQRYWASYARTWTRWNHVRTAAALLGAAVLGSAALGSTRLGAGGP